MAASGLDKLWDAVYDFVKGKGSAATKRLERLTKEMEGKRIEVGFNESSGSYEDGPTVAQVAAWNEYGTEHSPSRPFMRQTMKDYRDDISTFAGEALKTAAAEHGDIAPVLNKVGAYTKGKMQKEIRDGDWTPNAPSTIAKKGSSRPLIDSGRMRQSIVYVIKEK